MNIYVSNKVKNQTISLTMNYKQLISDKYGMSENKGM